MSLKLLTTTAAAAFVFVACAPEGADTDYGQPNHGAGPGVQQAGQLQNAYCSVRTYHNDAVPFRGFATHDQQGPVIFIRSDGMQNPDLYRFILAHECGHHAHQNVSTPPASAEDNARRELDADCWAAGLMAQQGDFAAINAALQDITASPYYGQGPTPQSRYATVQQCASPNQTIGK